VVDVAIVVVVAVGAGASVVAGSVVKVGSGAVV
jgi:hypothetical protein